MGRELRSRAENWLIRLQMVLRLNCNLDNTVCQKQKNCGAHISQGELFCRKKSPCRSTDEGRRAYMSIYPHIYSYMSNISNHIFLYRPIGLYIPIFLYISNIYPKMSPNYRPILYIAPIPYMFLPCVNKVTLLGHRLGKPFFINMAANRGQ